MTMAQCAKTTKDGKVRCQGREGHEGGCFLGGVTLADFDRASAAREAETSGRVAIETVRKLIDAWQAAPIYVTGEGATRFLDCVHACECLVDSLPPVTPTKDKR